MGISVPTALAFAVTVILTLTRNPIDAPTKPTTVRPVSAGAFKTGK